MVKLTLKLPLLLLLFSCSNPGGVKPSSDTISIPESLEIDSSIVEMPKDIIVVHDTSFVDLLDYTNEISLDFRYADTNNFIHQKVYDCVQCLLRKEVVEGLVKANSSLKERSLRLRLFDCYRPKSVQFKMWEIYPDARYVANPNKKGSIHNRGGAVDLTLETIDGEQLDMGTDFDHFGKEAHIDYKELSDTVLSNRKILRDAMSQAGFTPIRTEWWHFNFGNSKKYNISNFPFDCE